MDGDMYIYGDFGLGSRVGSWDPSIILRKISLRPSHFSFIYIFYCFFFNSTYMILYGQGISCLQKTENKMTKKKGPVCHNRGL